MSEAARRTETRGQDAVHAHPGAAALALGASGIVFGDIGTSPLYTLRECLSSIREQHEADGDPHRKKSILRAMHAQAMSSPAIQVEVAARPEPSPWVISPAFDLVLLVGVTLTTLLPWLAADRFGVRGGYVLVAVALVNGPHLISTWTRVYLPRGERWARPIHYWLMPGLAFAFAFGCVALDEPGPTIVRTVIFYWASWHFAAQSWGVLRIYQRKHGAADGPSAQLERALIFLPAVFFVMHRLYTGPWTLFGSEIFHPRLAAWMLNAVGGVVAILAAAYLARFRLGSAGHAALVRPVYLACNAFGFFMPYVVIKNGTAAFAAAALWHALQYMAIVWIYNRRRWSAGSDPDARLISWVSQPGHSLAYVGLIALCAVLVYGVVIVASLFAWSLARWSLAVWTGLTLGHYYLDGVIWKFKRYDLGKQLVRH